MNFEPQKFFIGVIDLFSVLLPGALLTYLFKDDAGPFVLGDAYWNLTDTTAWMAFLFASYLLGHFVFLLGAAALDGPLYDRIRRATIAHQIARLANGNRPAWITTRLLAGATIKKDSDALQSRVLRIKQHHLALLGASGAVNAFQWSKAKLVLDNRGEATATVQRLEADSKFFRSFAIVILIVAAVYLIQRDRSDYWDVLIALPVLILVLWRYIEQRLKAVNQAYTYVLLLEAGAEGGYRQPHDQRHHPSHAGGVVYRARRSWFGRGVTDAQYLLIQASRDASEWVLPKGHIEPEEHAAETAVREVLEEAGIWARVERYLNTAAFRTGAETIEVRFYLMQAAGNGPPGERREASWFPFDEAMRRATHPETRTLLQAARDALLKR